MAIPKNSNERKNAPLTRLDHLALAFTAGQDVLSADLLGSIEGYATLGTDFIEPAGTTLPTWLGTEDVSAAGAPTLDYLANEVNGAYTLTLAATDEAENIALTGGDHRWIDPTKDSVTLFAFKVDAAAIPWTADQRFVAGLGTAYDATLDDTAGNAWFRMEGASANLLWETDDGTTDDDDNDTGVDVVDDTYLRCAIRLRPSTATALFYVNGSLVGEGDITDLSDPLQVIFALQKDGGTETEALVIDYVRTIQARS